MSYVFVFYLLNKWGYLDSFYFIFKPRTVWKLHLYKHTLLYQLRPIWKKNNLSSSDLTFQAEKQQI